MHFGLAGWSINRRFRREDNPLTLLEFPRTARDEWGFEAVELNSPFFASRDTAYLDELKRYADDVGVALWGIAVDGTGSLCAEDGAERQKNIEACAEWLQVSQHLGLTYARFNTGGNVVTTARVCAKAWPCCGAFFRE
jgi:sugar phosphate isomerase/epimerase